MRKFMAILIIAILASMALSVVAFADEHAAAPAADAAAPAATEAAAPAERRVDDLCGVGAARRRHRPVVPADTVRFPRAVAVARKAGKLELGKVGK